ncbi:FAD-dependent oxidoreductase [Pseudomonas sp. GD03944]|uniref:NAD(P)/FAD-dependent oxidoreductase n=1 Tax=Pseudomonas sp. GD03944 TaxID=2975409 RepID=UPI002446CB5E|nr:FAD-dependent oxidoreductase [Pseudomonas sp. GD03944]MDH1265691.1 FAD-dependent oxidoreductase [Pseudomonas sp. GD03944]
MGNHILIVGAGFAGLWSALGAMRLLDQQNRSDVQVTLLAPQAELRIRPRFYEPDAHSLFAPLDALFDATGVRFVQGLALQIDTQGREVTYRTADGEQAVLGYDRLILAAGSQLFRPPVPGLAEHAFDVDRIEQAVRLEQHLMGLASQPDTPARNTVVVVGGGFTGIETATELPTRLRDILGDDAKVRVVVIDRGAQIGAALGDGIRPAIVDASRELGLEWQLGTSVASIDAGGVVLDNGQRIDASTVVWTVGFRASPLTEQIPAPRDPTGRLQVDGYLRVEGLSDVYAAGDTARAATDELGNICAMSCQHAIPLGRYAGHNAAADLIGVKPRVYSQPKYVTCLDLGAWGAVYTEGWDRQQKLVGAEAKELKQQINTLWIYPPAATDRAAALAAADPSIPVA